MNRRSGSVLLVSVVLALLAAVVAAAVQSDQEQRHAQALRLVASESAAATCRLAIGRTLSRVVAWCSRPGDPGYRELRIRLVTTLHDEVDVTDLLGTIDVEPEPAMTWRRPGNSSSVGVGKPQLESLRCRLTSIRRLPDVPDELTARVRIETRARAKLSRYSVCREMTDVYDLRLSLAGVPRPFDQVGLYLGDGAMVTRAAEANDLRKRTLDEADRAVKRFEALAALPSPVSTTFQALADGMPGRVDRDFEFPALPEVPCLVVGLRPGRTIAMPGLDIASTLDRHLRIIERARTRLEDASGSGASPGLLLAAGRALATAINDSLLEVWTYHRVLRFVPRDGAEGRRLEELAARLTPTWTAARTMMVLTPDHELFSGWLKGERQLQGVHRVDSERALELKGGLDGCLALDARAPEIRLDGVSNPSSFLTVVAGKARVRVKGSCTAAVVSNDPASVDLDPAATLCGGLWVAARSGRLPLAGRLSASYDKSVGWSLESSLHRWSLSPLSIALSPVPVWSEEGR